MSRGSCAAAVAVLTFAVGCATGTEAPVVVANTTAKTTANAADDDSYRVGPDQYAKLREKCQDGSGIPGNSQCYEYIAAIVRDGPTGACTDYCLNVRVDRNDPGQVFVQLSSTTDQCRPITICKGIAVPSDRVKPRPATTTSTDVPPTDTVRPTTTEATSSSVTPTKSSDHPTVESPPPSLTRATRR
jgi:hypothetical protein